VEDENDQPERCRPVPSKNSIQAVLEVVLAVSSSFRRYITIKLLGLSLHRTSDELQIKLEAG
jgi:hypothetical protein